MATKWHRLLAEHKRSINFRCDITKGQFLKFKIFNDSLVWTFPISWKMINSLIKCITARKLHKLGNLRFSFCARKGSNIICWYQQRISQFLIKCYQDNPEATFSKDVVVRHNLQLYLHNEDQSAAFHLSQKCCTCCFRWNSAWQHQCSHHTTAE